MSMESYMLRNADAGKLKELGFVEGNRVTSMYVQIYELYSSLLLKYLDKLLNLKEKEEQMKNSPMQIQPLKEKDKDAYQSLSPLEFFYVRNDLRLENIPKDYLRILQKRCENKNDQLDAISEQIIQDTYLSVITNSNYKNGTHINYGPTTSTDFFAPNNSIVLGLRRDPEYEKGQGDNPEWTELYLKKEIVLKALERLIEEAAKKKKIPLEVIIYNEATVTKSTKEQASQK